MAPSPTRLYELADSIIDAIVDGYTNDGIDLPARRYVADGSSVVYDCEQLTVAVERTFPTDGEGVAESAPVSLTGHAAYARRAATLAIALIRCAPSASRDGAKPPTVEAIETSAQLVLADHQRIVNYLVDAQLTGDLAGCADLAFENWQSIGPEGGMVGGVLRLRVVIGRAE